MRKSSKVLSMVLAVLMAMSCFTGLTIVSASAAEDTKIYFELPGADIVDWGTTKSVYCHLYNVYGDGTMFTPSWQAKSTKCALDKATGLYYFDTADILDTAVDENGKQISHGGLQEGCDYAVIFSTMDSTKVVHQTCNVTMSKECVGGTIYCTGGKVENTEDSSKLDDKATWKEPELAAKYGPRANITSTGKVIGEFFGINQPKAQLVAQYIFNWAVKNAESATPATPELVQGICANPIINVEPKEVYNIYASDYEEQLADPELYPLCAPLETVATLLGIDPSEDDTTEAPTTEEPTEAPTTEEPTTEAPTTAEPTEAPTTAEPTEAPTTAEPTEAPTTAEPTEAPTTAEPTEAPTTAEPTEAPTTAEPTEAPTTEEPTEPENVYIVAGSDTLCGVNWDATAVENTMVKDGDVYTITFTDVNANKGYQLKVVANSNWDTSYGVNGQNVTFNVTDVCDVTVTFNPATEEITVTGEFVAFDDKLEIEKICAVGNGDGNWLNSVAWNPDDDSNKMEMISDDVYQIRYNDIDEYDNYQLKFAVNGSWVSNWGGAFEAFGVESAAIYDGDNIIIDTTGIELCDLIITLDLREFDFASKTGAKFTIIAEYEDVPPTPAAIYGDADGDGVISIKDATLIQKMVIELVECTDELEVICDVDGDGRVSINDVTMVQKYIAELGYNTAKVGQPVAE